MVFPNLHLLFTNGPSPMFDLFLHWFSYSVVGECGGEGGEAPLAPRDGRTELDGMDGRGGSPRPPLKKIKGGFERGLRPRPPNTNDDHKFIVMYDCQICVKPCKNM